MEWTTKLIVEEDAIDELNHVNNAVYVRYLEIARTEWFKEVANFAEMEKLEENISTVILHMDLLFKREAVLGDELAITTKPKKLGTKSFVVDQEIYNQRNELVMEASVTNVMFNMKDRESIPVVPEIAAVFHKN